MGAGQVCLSTTLARMVDAADMDSGYATCENAPAGGTSALRATGGQAELHFSWTAENERPSRYYA